ncbi:putative nuclear envelope reassembly [Trypoxylus dichotomus]
MWWKILVNNPRNDMTRNKPLQERRCFMGGMRWVTVLLKPYVVKNNARILKLEGLVLCWVLFWAILALCLPCAVVAQMCCPRTNVQRLRDDASSTVSNLNGKCSGKTSAFALYILMLLLLSSILLMLVSNDKLSRAIERSPSTVSVIFKDLETFIKNTQLQTSFVATSSFEITMDQVSRDLQDVEKLLGESFKKDFIEETGFDETLTALINLKSGSAEISRRVRELLRECNVAKGAGKLLQEGLSELSGQLNLARRYCTQKDRSLCESLQSTGLEVAFTVQELLTDPTLQYLDRIAHDNKFNASIDQTAKTLDSFPKHVEIETSSLRAAIVDALQLRRRQMYASVRSLEDISKSMTLSVRETGRRISELTEDVAAGDLWRYLSVLAICFLTFLAWVLYLCGSPCCCRYTKKTIFYLKLGIFITCILSITLWLYGSITFLLGGHGQTIICNPLYEDDFITLSNILDRDGLIFEEGYFTHVLKSNESLKTEEILRNCQRNEATYTTFRLENRLDLAKIFNYQNWEDLRTILKEFSFPTGSLRIFSSNLENNLEDYSLAASRNKFREIRSKISFPVTHKDLVTFYDQINSATRQISNTKSAINFEKVMIKTQEIISNELRVVENHRDSILYKLTALEILLQPVHLKIQNYLHRLAEAQILLEDRGAILAEKNAKRYVFHLEGRLHDLQRHVNEQITKKIGRCGPLWDTFVHLRQYICKGIVEPINALSCSYFISILIFLSLTPIVINLIAYYGEVNVQLLESLSNGHFDQELVMRDQSIWTSPQSESSPSGNNSLPPLPSPLNDENRWASPNSPGSLASLPPGPPPPPRPPSIASITKAAPRLAGLYTIAKAKSIKSKYDPLKFIERTWKTPRSVQSPRGWL